jgi:hypothetical protein
VRGLIRPSALILISAPSVDPASLQRCIGDDFGMFYALFAKSYWQLVSGSLQ